MSAGRAIARTGRLKRFLVKDTRLGGTAPDSRRKKRFSRAVADDTLGEVVVSSGAVEVETWRAVAPTNHVCSLQSLLRAQEDPQHLGIRTPWTSGMARQIMTSRRASMKTVARDPQTRPVQNREIQTLTRRYRGANCGR